MAKGFKTGAVGGTFLNFKVVGGTTPPTNPRENTIWVNTDKDITSWAFIEEEPSNPTEGMVWFSIGTSGKVSFNALKKNVLQVYPLTTKQYIDGAWAEKVAQTYQSGTFTGWQVYLFKSGDQCLAVTGGWETGVADHPDWGEERPSISFSDVFTISITSEGGNNRGTVNTANAIDLSKYTKMYFEVAGSSKIYYFDIYLSTNKGFNYLASLSLDGAGAGTYTIDVSAINQSCYVMIMICSAVNMGTAVMQFKKIWLE